MLPNLLSGCCEEQISAVEVIWIVLRMSRRVEPSLQSAGAAVREVAHPWPRSSRNLVFWKYFHFIKIFYILQNATKMSLMLMPLYREQMLLWWVIHTTKGFHSSFSSKK